MFVLFSDMYRCSHTYISVEGRAQIRINRAVESAYPDRWHRSLLLAFAAGGRRSVARAGFFDPRISLA